MHAQRSTIRQVCSIGLIVAISTACGSEPRRAPTAATSTPSPAATASIDIAITSPKAGQTVTSPTTVEGRATPDVTVLLAGGCVRCQALARADGAGRWTARLRVRDGVIEATTSSGDAGDSVRVKVRAPRARRREREPRVETEPEIATPTAVPRPERLVVVGDSLAVGIRPYLEADVFDARTGRPLAEGMRVIRAADLSSAVLAVSLFTNDDPRNVGALEAAVRETVAEVDGCAVWATIARPPLNGVSYRAGNARLRALQAELAPKLIVVPWAETVAAQPALLTGDGVHPTPSGYEVRARLYEEAIASCGG